jgi:hypothetical protein
MRRRKAVMRCSSLERVNLDIWIDPSVGLLVVPLIGAGATNR